MNILCKILAEDQSFVVLKIDPVLNWDGKFNLKNFHRGILFL